MAVNLSAWDETIGQVRLRLQSSERFVTELSRQLEAETASMNKWRTELEHLEKLGADLIVLLAARDEVRS